MEKFVHQQNLVVLRKQLAETPNEAQRLQLSRLLAEEEEKDQMPPNSKSAPQLATSIFWSALQARCRLLALSGHSNRQVRASALICSVASDPFATLSGRKEFDRNSARYNA